MIEAVDILGTDGGDPNDERERAPVAGHEFGHIYGEENHLDQWFWHCLDDCRLMAQAGGNLDVRDLFFLEESKDETICRFFLNEEPTC